jgi:hypothetical protein
MIIRLKKRVTLKEEFKTDENQKEKEKRTVTQNSDAVANFIL